MKTKETVTAPDRMAELSAARSAARAASEAIASDFGKRNITSRKGKYDVQLRADVVAERVIVERLTKEFSDYGIVSEEEMQDAWEHSLTTWVVDPLDGTNNFGFGIAHCAVAITLFENDAPVMALVHDPILGREFTAPAIRTAVPPDPFPVPLRHATVALVTDYSEEGRVVGRGLADALGRHCKRVTTMWAPALDLALVSSGALDGMVCRNASLLDVCAGIFLVQRLGGCVLDPSGRPLRLRKSLHSAPVSFVAAGSEPLARELLGIAPPAHAGKAGRDGHE
ncbi:hypothetical protein CUT44_29440 [Streptomyces carminius]|uniref:Inositol monophosphatase n=1 Tax=Streptomyces carminius TaxID=2665496 RepID=A0A2M8LR02_9ACTN|nr:inositol monophosphatase [Streptomyces carminius]PJE94369.1 hypothetical protein CUT44_29440 [Streptomyces carminius]